MSRAREHSNIAFVPDEGGWPDIPAGDLERDADLVEVTDVAEHIEVSGGLRYSKGFDGDESEKLSEISRRVIVFVGDVSHVSEGVSVDAVGRIGEDDVEG